MHEPDLGRMANLKLVDKRVKEFVKLKLQVLVEVRMSSGWWSKKEIMSFRFLFLKWIKEESTDGSGSVCHVDFYVISYVLGVWFWFRMPRIEPEAKLDAACIVDPSPYTPIWAH